MNKIYFLFSVTLSVFLYSQVGCDTLTKEKLFYVTFEMKSKEMYSVKMSGIFENYDIKLFSNENPNQFIESFYKSGVYTPNIEKGYSKMLNTCMEPSNIQDYINKNSNVISIIADVQNKVWRNRKIILKTGEIVIFYILKIEGTFFNVNKKNKGIFTSSLEWDISDIKEIQNVYIPFDNLKIEKPGCNKKYQ